MKQLDRNQEREAIALIEEIPWADMDLHIRSVERALERAVEATAAEFPLWEAAGEQRFVDEFSVSEEDLTQMSTEWRLAYIARPRFRSPRSTPIHSDRAHYRPLTRTRRRRASTSSPYPVPTKHDPVGPYRKEMNR
jgi:hypothetical protein